MKTQNHSLTVGGAYGTRHYMEVRGKKNAIKTFLKIFSPLQIYININPHPKPVVLCC